ncbi:MAG TPA: alcohol dehydrogenase catalytic domain-containing protein, partial [Terriglobales bacterium]|nr:alcohol dehydrogenase catalytic domain-containing protein [Terriglobales bacterium]
MRAMVLRQTAEVATNPLHQVEMPIPTPGEGDVLVKVHVCGVCRTDLHVVEGELSNSKLPLIPGHQVVGTVCRLGKGVTAVKEGDRVGIAWLQSTCQCCDFCLSDRENLCLKARFTGYQVDGGYAEY